MTAPVVTAPPTVHRSMGRSYTAPKRSVPWFKYLSLAPLAIFVAAFVALPVAQLLWMSIGDVRLISGAFNWEFVGLDNFTRMLGDEVFAESVKNSVVFVTTTVFVTVVLGIGLALATDRLVRTGQLVQNVLLWPTILTPVVISVVWILILNPQVGLLNKVLETLGASRQTWLGDPVGAMISIIVVDVWHWTPIVYLLVYTALRGLDSAVLEAAAVDGAGFWRATWSVVLPLLAPTIAGVVGIRIVMGVKAFDEMYLLTFGGPGTSTTVINIYLRSVFFDSFEYGYGAALAVTIVVLVVGVLFAGFGSQRLLRRLTRAT